MKANKNDPVNWSTSVGKLRTYDGLQSQKQSESEPEPEVITLKTETTPLAHMEAAEKAQGFHPGKLDSIEELLATNGGNAAQSDDLWIWVLYRVLCGQNIHVDDLTPAAWDLLDDIRAKYPDYKRGPLHSRFTLLWYTENAFDRRRDSVQPHTPVTGVVVDMIPPVDLTADGNRQLPSWLPSEKQDISWAVGLSTDVDD